MAQDMRARGSALRNGLRAALIGPQIMAFVPALTLAAFWMGGEVPLILTALGVPALYAMLARPGSGAFASEPPPERIEDAAAAALAATAGTDTVQALFLVEPGDAADLAARLGPRGTDQVARAMETALKSVLREGDRVLRDGPGLRFAVLPRSHRRVDLESAIQIASRLQSAVEEPVALDRSTLYLGCAVGLCLSSRAPAAGPAAWIDAAAAALQEASSAGPSAVRAFSPAMPAAPVADDALAAEAGDALEEGGILAWFQPQVCTDTGRISGMEALARWTHPVHGLIPPDRFLPALAARGRMERLGEVMLYQALTALRSWDRAGLDIPRVGVNLAPEDLRNPKLYEKIAWELDRFGIAPARLCIEVLETVVAETEDDVVSRNVNGLSALGCGVDLDDFGTGAASIASIRRFAITRLKIDRSFVTGLDRDSGQRRIVSAIVTMAEQLDLETVAEGVETVGEHTTLAQLGCGHVQGFGIARPMPYDQTLDWIRAHRAKLAPIPRIGDRPA